MFSILDKNTIKLLNYNFFLLIFKMSKTADRKVTGVEKFTGKVTIKRKPAKKIEETVQQVEEQREPFLIGFVKELSGITLTSNQINEILTNLNIDPSKDLLEDDLLLIYNIFSEPLISKDNNQFEFREVILNNDSYFKKLKEDSIMFRKIMADQRVQAIYEFLPSLETSRINFQIDKDIFRNKPLLGKGLYKCKHCGSDNTEDYELQTRSADEPMKVFVNCRDCGHKFSFN
jgi:DNA-directed RNA polymerase subunit M/transcription elongation factor TFIIS